MPGKPFTLQEIKQIILYEDSSLLVVHKPAGLAVQSKSVLQPDLETLLSAYRQGEYLALIHRLDQPVEGILVFAKTKAAAASLADQTRSHLMSKRYLAVVTQTEDAPMLFPKEKDSHPLVDYLKKDSSSNLSRVVPPDTPGAKRSELTYQTLAQVPPEGDQPARALLSILLGTGRHHQIRVQLSHAGLPIVGDTRYGGIPTRGLALCAISLTFRHPAKEMELTFSIIPEADPFAPFLPTLQSLPNVGPV